MNNVDDLVVQKFKNCQKRIEEIHLELLNLRFWEVLFCHKKIRQLETELEVENAKWHLLFDLLSQKNNSKIKIIKDGEIS